MSMLTNGWGCSGSNRFFAYLVMLILMFAVLGCTPKPGGSENQDRKNALIKGLLEKSSFLKKLEPEKITKQEIAAETLAFVEKEKARRTQKLPDAYWAGVIESIKTYRTEIDLTNPQRRYFDVANMYRNKFKTLSTDQLESLERVPNFERTEAFRKLIDLSKVDSYLNKRSMRDMLKTIGAHRDRFAKLDKRYGVVYQKYTKFNAEQELDVVRKLSQKALKVIADRDADKWSDLICGAPAADAPYGWNSVSKSFGDLGAYEVIETKKKSPDSNSITKVRYLVTDDSRPEGSLFHQRKVSFAFYSDQYTDAKPCVGMTY